MQYLSRIAAVVFVAMTLVHMQQPAIGGEQKGDVGVKSFGKAICTFRSAPTSLDQDNMSISSMSSNQSSISINELINEESAYLRRASVRFRIPAVCNTAFFVALTSANGGLTPQTTPTVVAGSFLQRINYRAEVKWGSQSIELVADGTPNKRVQSGYNNGPFWGDIVVSMHIDEVNNRFDVPVLSSTYSDTLIVQIGAIL